MSQPILQKDTPQCLEFWTGEAVIFHFGESENPARQSELYLYCYRYYCCLLTN